MHVRTVAAILVWVAVVLLLINTYFRSEGILLLAIALIVLTIIIYFRVGRRR